MDKDERIIFVEFHQGMPFSVITTNDRDYRKDYTFDYSKHYDSLYWENVGSGPGRGEPIIVTPCIGTTPTCYWAAPGIEVVEQHYDNCGPLVRLDAFPMPYTLDNLFTGSIEDGAEFDSSYGDTIYCAICDDRFPVDYPCRHMGYYNGEWFGCGSIDVEPERHKLSLFYVLEKLRIAKQLRRAIVIQDYLITEHPAMIGCGDLEIRLRRQDFGRRLEDAIYTPGQFETVVDASTLGMLWLFSLEPKVTIEAEKLTIGWISDYLERKRRGESFDKSELAPAA